MALLKAAVNCVLRATLVWVFHTEYMNPMQAFASKCCKLCEVNTLKFPDELRYQLGAQKVILILGAKLLLIIFSTRCFQFLIGRRT